MRTEIDASLFYSWPRYVSLSTALVADYQLHLPNKNLRTEKLRELKELDDVEADDDNL